MQLKEIVLDSWISSWSDARDTFEDHVQVSLEMGL